MSQDKNNNDKLENEDKIIEDNVYNSNLSSKNNKGKNNESINNDVSLNSPKINNEDISFDSNYSSGFKRGLYYSYEKRLFTLIIFVFALLIIFIVYLFKILNFVANNKDIYSENSSSNYSVCLKENNYYEEECLGEDRQYVSNIVENIPYIFTYNAFYDKKIKKDIKYSVDAHLKIYSQDNQSQVLYEKKFVLMDDNIYSDTNTVFTVSNSVVIPFKDYNNIVTSYSNDYSILTDSEVLINFYVNDNVYSSLSIPLGKQSFIISKSDTSNSYAIDRDLKSSITATVRFYITVLLISGIGFIVFILLLARFLLKYRKKNDEYSKYKSSLHSILKNYDRIIVEVKNIDNLLIGKNIIKVESFLELVDVRDTLDKPIMHVKINNIKDAFYVDDHDKVYSFVMKSK